MTTTPPPGSGPGFIPPRTLLIVFVALVIGLVIGVLTYVAYGNPAGAVIAGLGAFGAAMPVLHKMDTT